MHFPIPPAFEGGGEAKGEELKTAEVERQSDKGDRDAVPTNATRARVRAPHPRAAQQGA